MPDRTFRPKESAALLAAREQAYLTAIEVMLFQTITPDETTTLATLVANEATFDGYARTVVPVALPITASLGATAFLILSNVMASFIYGPAGSPPIVNTCTGMAILQKTAVGPPAVFAVYNVTVFDGTGIPMGNVGDIIEKVLSQVIGN